MFAIAEGTGPDTLVVFSGNPAASFELHRALPVLVDRGYRVVVFDHVGYGFSDKPNEVRMGRIANI